MGLWIQGFKDSKIPGFKNFVYRLQEREINKA
jgi:hypothetical protein